MPCYRPLKGWYSSTYNENGKRPIVFKRALAQQDDPLEVPCGQCIGCKLEKSRQWALRCVNESQLHERNSFITLTYSDEFLPSNASLNVQHFQKFMKRLRKYLDPIKIRFFHCGEYGSNDHTNSKHVRQYGLSNLGRPHYHALIFGYDFSNSLEIFKYERDISLYTSSELKKLWPYGFNTVGELTFESAAYCARYITKKINGEQAEEHYTRINPDTGEMTNVSPEYITMSRRPGIGSDWYRKFKSDVYPKDFTTVRGKKLKPPKFYDKILEIEDPEMFETVKKNRELNANEEENTFDRLLTREEVKKQKAKLLKRNLNE